MQFVWLEDFLTLSDLGNFTRAAQARNVTQPAFSRRIRALEDELGTPLFDRCATGVTLTSAGAALRPGAEDLVQRMRQVVREVRRVGSEEDATLQFAATHALSFTFLPSWMRDLERLSPVGPLRLVSDSLRGCEALMLQGDVHFLLSHHHKQAPGLFFPPRFKSKVLGHDRLEPFSAPGPNGNPLWTLDGDAKEISYLAYSSESGLGRILTATIFDQQPVERLKTVVTSHLAAALKSLLRDGRGLAWLPRALAEEDLAAGRLVPASVEDRWNVHLDIVITRPALHQGSAAEDFWSRIPDNGRLHLGAINLNTGRLR